MPATPDYQQLIDDETRAFIARTADFYPEDTVKFSIQQQREIYDTMCREFFSGYPPGVGATDITLALPDGQIPCREYQWLTTTAQAVVLYLHGGGFVVGGLESHDDVCAELCARTGYRVIAVDYRLSPEFEHPAAFNDSLAVFLWALEHYQKPLVLCGDSAGGNLAAAVAHEARNRGLDVAGQVLIYPGLGGDIDSGSYIEHANAPLLTRAEIEFYADIRSRDEVARARPSYAPLRDSNFASLAPTIVFSAECDPLCDDGLHYCAAIERDGGQSRWHKEAGLVHGYLRARHTVARARECFSRIVASVSALGQGNWPSE